MNSLAHLYPVLAAVVAYLLGSLSFAVIVSRIMGLHDPRSYGSKNPGATNVLRSGNKGAAIATLLLDALKGFLPVAAVRWWGTPYGLEDGSVALVALAAFGGHIFPIFFRLIGGKGVATGLGVVFGINAWLGLVACVTWLLVAYAFRYSSLAALVTSVFAPICYILGDGVAWDVSKYIASTLGVIAVTLLWRHLENIHRLIKGTESKLGAPKASPAGVTATASKMRSPP